MPDQTPETPPPNTQEYSVSELSAALKRVVEGNFEHVRVRAELSGFKRAASGHLYMALKDEKAALDGVMWRGVAGRLAFNPEDGLEVIATGKLTTYPGRSKYQLVIEHMEPAGVGALMALLEERKKKLAAEGLFDAERKQAIPYLPKVIGVVTSPTGAVIRDILHRLADRFPRSVYLWPVVVQGEKAAGEVAAAIRGFDALGENSAIPRPDLLIVARGGGSLEDLWSFNEEEVVRAVAECTIPVISAVGHETDTTLIDYVSDRRAPTPTAAAEMAVPVRADLIYTVADLDRRMGSARTRLFDQLSERLAGLARALPRPKDLLGLASQKLDELSSRLPRALSAVAERNRGRLGRASGGLSPMMLKNTLRIKSQSASTASKRLDFAYRNTTRTAAQRLDAAGRVLSSLSYQRVLDRGYAVVRNAEGATVTNAESTQSGVGIEIEWHDGRRDAVLGKNSSPRPKTAAKKVQKAKPKKRLEPKRPKGRGQGELF